MYQLKSYFFMVALVLFAFHSDFAQSGGTFVIEKSVIAGGGEKSTGGTFVLDGTIGQSLAGTQSNGGSFTLLSGFWASSATVCSRR